MHLVLFFFFFLLLGLLCLLVLLVLVDPLVVVHLLVLGLLVHWHRTVIVHVDLVILLLLQHHELGLLLLIQHVDAAIVGGMAFLGDRQLVAIGHQKGRDTNDKLYRNFGMPHPEGYRKAIRVMNLSNKFRKPLICFIDTPGAGATDPQIVRSKRSALAVGPFHDQVAVIGKRD